MTTRTAWTVARDTVAEFLGESPFQLAGALSFYTLLSLSPLVLVVVGVTGLVWSQETVQAELIAQVEQLVGAHGAETVSTVLTAATDRGRSAVSVVLGLATLLVGATTVFAQLQASLNQIWHVRAAPTRFAVWVLIRTRLLSMGLVLSLGLLLLVSLVASAALAAFSDYLARLVPGGGVIARALEFLVSLFIIGVLIGAVFEVLPDARIAWRHAWFGGVVTAVLFGIGKFFIGLYLGRASIGSAYGAAGSLVVFLVWVYYSSLILLFGAKLTEVYARLRGEPIEPAPYAVVVPRP
jgi:membrane protein